MGSQAGERLGTMGNAGKKMSALEVAALGKNRASKDKEGARATALQVDLTDEDWNVVVEQAKRGGPKSWFASKVDFSLNGSPFVGKVGYSVQGGVVPLFDGAALDVQNASLTAEDPKKAEPNPKMGAPAGYKNWVTGNGGLLVLAPVGADNVIPVIAKDMVITEKTMTARAEKKLDFQAGERVIHAESLDLWPEMAILNDVRVTEDGVERAGKYQEKAAMDGAGIRLVPNPDYQPPQEEAVPSPVSSMPERQPSALEEAAGGVTELAKDLTKDSKPIAVGIAGKSEDEDDDDDDEGGFGLQADVQKGNVQAGFNFQALSGELGEDSEDESDEEEEEDAPIWEQLLDALKSTGKETFLNALKASGRAMTDGDWNQVAEVFEEKWDQLKAIYDGFSDEELREGWKLLPSQGKAIFQRKLTDEAEIRAYLEKLVPTGPVKEFLGMEGDKKEAEGAKSADGSAGITLAEIPIFPPFLNFSVGLLPKYRFAPYIRGGVENLYQLWSAGEDAPTNLELKAGVAASLSLRASAELRAGLPLLIEGFGGLWAQAALKGAGVDPGKGVHLAADTGADTALEVRANLPLKKDTDGSIRQAGDLNAEILGGFTLTGSVGANVGVKSTLLMWEKDLWEKEFASWNLLAIALNLSVSKAPADGLMSGWNLNEASIRIAGPGDGIGAAFLDQNTSGRRYGLYEPEPVKSEKYDGIESDFEVALQLLKDFAGKGENSNESLAISNQEGQSGLADTLDQMTGLQNQFLRVWVDAQNELENMERYLEELSQGGMESRQIQGGMKNLEKHSSRIAHMEKWGAGSQGDILDYYMKHGSKPGSGYLDSLEAQAEDEVTTYEAIVDYERNRYREKTGKHQERIDLLTRLIDAGTQEEEILKAYRENGGKAAFKNLSQFQNTEALLDYEMKKVEDTAKGSSANRHRDVLKLTGTAGTDADFFKEYVKKLSQKDLLRYGNPDWLMDYERAAFEGSYREKEKLTDSSAAKEHRRDVRDYYTLEGQMAQLRAGVQGSGGAAPEHASENASGGGSPDTERGALDRRLLTQFRNAKKPAKSAKGGAVPQLSEIFGERFYGTATVEDLLELELNLHVREEEGRALAEHVKQAGQTGTGNSQEAAADPLAAALGKDHKKKALTRFGAYLENQEAEALIPYLTIEGLLEYARSSLGKKKTADEKAQTAREIQYLERGRIKLEATDPEKRREVEEEYIAGYFEAHGKAEREYRAALGEGEAVNLPLMLEALSQDPDNKRYAMLKQAKAEGLSDYEALAQYLELGGEKEEITAHQKEKEAAGGMTLADASRYYEYRLHKQTNHFKRYEVLKELYDKHAPYEEMLAAYAGLGGGKAYGEAIKKDLEKGRLRDTVLTREDVVRFEEERLNRKREKHTKRLDLISEKKDSGADYKEILKAYENQAKQDGTGAAAGIKRRLETVHLTSFATGFEKSLRKAEKYPSAAQLLAYEEGRKAELGKKHAERLRFLLDLSPDSGDVLSAPLVKEEERKVKRDEYLNRAKRLKKGKWIRKAAGIRTNELLNRSNDEMKESILSYETGRKEYYESKLKDVLDRRLEMEQMRERLRKTSELCTTICLNLRGIRKDPGTIFDKIKEFEESAGFIKLHRGPSLEADTAQKERLITGAKKAAEEFKNCQEEE